jgi:hypothetical protein
LPGHDYEEQAAKSWANQGLPVKGLYNDRRSMTSRRKCSATRKDGAPCRGRPVRGSEPPLCPAHTKTTTARPSQTQVQSHGFYNRTYTLEEVADLVNLAVDDSLADELAATRVAVRRVMGQLHQELAPEEFARLTGLVFTGANTIARLVRAQQAMAGGASGQLARAIAQALDELAAEWGVPL